MSLSTYLLEYGRHVARLRRRRRRRAYAPTSNTASHDNHKKILHGFPFLSRDDYGAPLGGPSGRRSSAINHCAIALGQCPMQLSRFTIWVIIRHSSQ